MDTAEAQPKTSLLANIAHVSALVSAGAIILSLTYNFMYFQIVDRELLSAMTINDHIASAITFLPITLGSMIVGMIGSYMLGPHWALPHKVSADPTERVRSWTQTMRPVFRFFIVVAVLGGVADIMLGNPMNPQGSAFLFTVLLVIGLGEWAKRDLIYRDAIYANYRLSMIMIIVVVGVGFTGMREAYADLKSSAHDVTITLTDATIIGDSRLLRFIEKGVIVRHQDDTIFVPFAQIRRVEKHEPFTEPKTRACAWFGYCSWHFQN